MDETHFLWKFFQLDSISIVAGLITAALSFRLFFNDMESFTTCIKYWLKPDHWGSSEGLFSEEWWSETKFFLWLALSTATAYVVNSFMVN